MTATWSQNLISVCRKVRTMKHPLVLVALIGAIVVPGCAHRSMVKHNRQSHVYTTRQLLAECSWLKDVAKDWRTTVDLSGSELPGYDDLGAYPLGNGRVFGINGLLVPLGALRNWASRVVRALFVVSRDSGRLCLPRVLPSTEE